MGKSKLLFKGWLMMLIRDVSEHPEVVYGELQSVINQQKASGTESVYETIFSGKLISQCLTNYKIPEFEREIVDTRDQYFIKDLSKKDKRWVCGQDNENDLLQALKMTLSKIYLGDEESMDEKSAKMKAGRIIDEGFKIYLSGGEEFKEKSLHFKTLIMGVSVDEKVYHKKISLENDDGDKEKTIHNPILFNLF
jgi:hypothetical protein